MTMELNTTHHHIQNETWPRSGEHVLAQYDDQTIVVHQAYRPSIADYAVAHQQFGGEFSFNRMSWIKPNFLWMMYRSGWAEKNAQERVLAIRIARTGFDQLCRDAVKSTYDPACFTDPAAWKAAIIRSDVRLQWDPDHGPKGEPLERRAVQLGLRGSTLRAYATQWIHQNDDITPFVHEQKSVLDQQGESALMTPTERVYPAPAGFTEPR